jgi:hypothetical protein
LIDGVEVDWQRKIQRLVEALTLSVKGMNSPQALHIIPGSLIARVENVRAIDMLHHLCSGIALCVAISADMVATTDDQNICALCSLGCLAKTAPENAGITIKQEK